MASRSAALLLVFASCHAHHAPASPKATVRGGDDLTLYRDAALIRQRVDVDLKGPSTIVKVKIAAGVTADQLVVLDRGGMSISSLVIPAEQPEEGSDEVPEDGAGIKKVEDRPLELTLDVAAPTPGHYTIELGYMTNRLDWTAAYTMTANPARDHAVVRGALAIHNKSGITLRASTSHLIDAELGNWRGKSSEQLAALLVGATPSSTPPATPREMGPLLLGNGETRVELLPPVTRAMSAVLVYDPVGTKYDHTGASPLTDQLLGLETKPQPRVTENFEVIRDKHSTEGMPAGPVRLLEQRADGSLAVLGEARLFDASSRVADVDTIAVGTAESVTGSRERRELTVDEEGKRVVEEFMLTIDNQRAYPVRVLLREHLYRGQNWALAYHSQPDAVKEGPQQIAMRQNIPAKSKGKVLYVVVYTWGQ